MQTLKLTSPEFSLELSRGAGTASPSETVSIPVPQPVKNEDPAVKAPLVGVFYVASAPGEAPYVTVGDRVKKGQTLCLLEAMKMLSQVTAPCDCVITAVLKENGSLAAFDEPLFRYRPC